MSGSAGLRSRLAVALLCVLLAAALLLSGASPATARADGASASPAQLRWKACPGRGQCARLTVPLDYDHPDNGRTIRVALFRVRALDPKHRIGSLLINPGGPGASGVQFARSFARMLPRPVRARFDIVGFDPRGTGDTVPVKCRDNLDSVFALDYSPDTPAERLELDAAMTALASSCVQRSGNRLPYVATQSTARDLDHIRQALGDKKLTYVGYSYGTYLGSLYANFFPRKVRALVFDGAIDPQLSALQLGLQQAVGFEQGLDAFLDSCSKDRECAFRNGGEAPTAFDRLSAQVDAERLPARNGRTLGPGEFDLGVAQALYSGRFGWPTLADALAAAATGDGQPLLELADQYTGRHDNGTYDNMQDAFWSIGCLDGPNLGGPDAYQAAEPIFRQQAPRVGVSILNYGLICGYWPVPPVKSPAPLRAEGAAPILVIGTTGDPATPLPWAESLARELRSGVLLVANGEQHTSFATSGNACVDAAVVRYLVDLKPPRSGSRCR